MKVVKFLAIATFMIAPLLAVRAPGFAQASPPAASSPAMPPSWDPKMPLPPGAVLLGSTAPKAGVVHSADFEVSQSYEDLIAFYRSELPKAGFELGPKIAAPARKVYDLSILKGDMLDNLTLSPSAKDPTKMNIHIAWTPDAAKKPASKAP